MIVPQRVPQDMGHTLGRGVDSHDVTPDRMQNVLTVLGSTSVFRPEYLDDRRGFIRVNAQERAQVVREPFLLGAQPSVRQHQVDRKGERRGAEFLWNDRCGCLHDAGRPVIVDALGGGCEHLVQPVATVTAEQLHPSDDMFDAVRFVS